MKTETVCLDCGHTFDPTDYEGKLSAIECPECGSVKKRTKVTLEEGDEIGSD